MRIEKDTKAEVFTIFDAPRLDPVTVIIQDTAPKQGRLIVSCYGTAWSGYWGATGCDLLRAFLADCNTDYIAGKMVPGDRKVKKNEGKYLERIIDAVKAALLEPNTN